MLNLIGVVWFCYLRRKTLQHGTYHVVAGSRGCPQVGTVAEASSLRHQ